MSVPIASLSKTLRISVQILLGLYQHILLFYEPSKDNTVLLSELC